MGQEILYCFKCRKRIVGSDFAAGQAYQVGLNASCSACAAEFLQTLGPKDREALLAKMFKATQGRQKPPLPSSHRAERGPVATPRSLPARKASGALPIGIAVALVAVVIIGIVASSRGSDPAPVVKEPGPVPRPTPPPALQKARQFARDNPADLTGQIRTWEEAVSAAEKTPFYEEARRELGAVMLRRQQAVERSRTELEERVRALMAKEQFGAAIEEFEKARKLPEWTGVVDRRIAEIRESASALFGREKQKAVTADQVRALRDRVQQWGVKALLESLPPIPERPWKSILGPDLGSLRGKGGGGWSFENGMLVKDRKNDNAAQTTASFEDAEVRVRFEFAETGLVWFSARQGAGKDPAEVKLYGPALQALGPGLHELLFVCRGAITTATLDGKPVDLKQGDAVSGCLQFNADPGGLLRVHSIEIRPLE